MKRIFTAATMAVFILTTACRSNAGHNDNTDRQTLAEARKGFTTKLIRHTGAKGPVPAPPPGLFSTVQYPTSIGSMVAYLGVVPDDGKLHPAMIWITGGFGNDIGDVWTEQGAENDQSAAVIKQAGVVMMYPAQRGGNTNPGSDETCYGEVDDIIAAATFLSKQKGVDPARIYLGGHSTGGTKVLLVAACSKMFRAVFSMGPVSDVRLYGDDNMNFDTGNEQEFMLRSPVRWLHAIQTPTYIFEGAAAPGNIDELEVLQKHAEREGDTLLKFYGVKNKDHFSEIRPVSEIIAQKIMADDKGGNVTMDFSREISEIK